MSHTSTEIIKGVSKERPYNRGDSFRIRNIASSNLDAHIESVYQFIVELTIPDHMELNTDRYKGRIQEKFSEIAHEVRCFSYYFNQDEKGELEQVLTELGEHYDIEIDAKQMIKDFHRYGAKDERGIFIVVSVVSYGIAIAKPND